MSHLRVPLANNKGEGDGDDNHGDSTPFHLLSCILTSLHYTTQGGTIMNSEENP